MDVGYNYPAPCNRMGNWIGPPDRVDSLPKNYASDFAELPFRSFIERNLNTLRQNGVTVVRWFIMGNGFNYGQPPVLTPTGRASAFPNPRFVAPPPVWQFSPPTTLDPLFLSHFVQLLELHKKAGMKMIPSLVSFEFFRNSESADGGGHRSDIVKDPTKRGTFLSTVLDPFLGVSVKYRDWIYAWEVANEPTWATRLGPHGALATLTRDELNTFLRQALDRIDVRGFPSTVGHRFFEDLDNFFTGSMPQFHYYDESTLLSDPSGLPKATPKSVTKAGGVSAQATPFLGEFGSVIGDDRLGRAIEKSDPGGPTKASYGTPWTDDFANKEDQDPSNILTARLGRIASQGYQLALVWPEFDANDQSLSGKPGEPMKDELKISSAKLGQIKRFADTHR